jgi:DNA-binding transcriptional regulator YbjK
MSDRRERLLDAAIQVVGGGSIRWLTHRAVDATAGVPTGSCANHFRTRAELLGALVERVAAHERQACDDIAARTVIPAPEDVAAVLVDVAHRSAGANRRLTLTRLHVVGTHVTGLVLHRLAIPDPGFDPTDHVTRLTAALLGAGRPAAVRRALTGP